MTENLNHLNEETRDAWNANAQVWDEKMKDEGNDFFNVLCWPVLASFLDASTRLSASFQPDTHILDIACGNGLTTRKLVRWESPTSPFRFFRQVDRICQKTHR
jgi:2-polyprenyl-3-methyl-5-hydroxy-6-metoxy-1,4-benzoquinol methylase